MTSLRIGHGYDVHRLVPERPLILGGVNVPFDLGLLGHSDADVLTHAIMDALLGAAALGDIGRHFPDCDEAYRGADSLKLASHVAKLLKDHGYAIVNVDATLIAQRPKIAPYIEQMQMNIANALGILPEQINLKATTEEHLGFTGEGLGMAAHAV
ncbi:MAG: 2-C-methyl-D-erythritol 2,4-cyclodiphosphate synthase, partial [Clostridia bacterium]|nr:2-C-methyl-D-erythritol 2,4-cyclodiphosphate synthase [Clostridia bacterium]